MRRQHKFKDRSNGGYAFTSVYLGFVDIENSIDKDNRVENADEEGEKGTVAAWVNE